MRLLDRAYSVGMKRSRTQLAKSGRGRKPGCDGSNSRRERAIFSLVACCRPRGIDLQQYLDEVMRALPDWPKDRYRELSPKHRR